MKTTPTLLITALASFLFIAAPAWPRDPIPPSAPRPIGPPSPECVPDPTEPNTWSCDGDPNAQALPTAEQEMVDFIQAHHPSFTLEHDGHSIVTDSIPRAYEDEYLKAKNPSALLNIGNLTPERILEIHNILITQIGKIHGYQGSGIDKDGIYINADPIHGSFPSYFLGAKVRIKPADTGADLGTTFTFTQRPVRAGIQIDSGDQNGGLNGTLSGIVLGRGQPWAILPAHLLPYPLCAQTAPGGFPGHLDGYPLVDASRFDHIPQDASAKYFYLISPPSYNADLANSLPLPGWPRIAFTSIWDNPSSHKDPKGNLGTDLSAGALDSNRTPRDQSLGTEIIPGVYEGNASKDDFDGFIPTGPNTNANLVPLQGVVGAWPGMRVDVLTADLLNTGIYKVPAVITDINVNICVVDTCGPDINFPHCHGGTFQFQSLSRPFNPGDSGSPIVTNGSDFSSLPDYYVGFLSYGKFDTDPTKNLTIGGGETYNNIKHGLLLDQGSDDLTPRKRYNITNFVTASHTVKLDVSMEPTPAVATKAGTWACTYARIKNTGKFKAVKVAATWGLTTNNNFIFYNAKNELNTPQNIPAGKTKKFRVCLFSLYPLAPQDYAIDFYGQNALAPLREYGFNTLAASWYPNTPPSFNLSLETTSGDNIVSLSGIFGSASFKVQATNVGPDGTVTIRPITNFAAGSSNVSLLVCELDRKNIVTGLEECAASGSDSIIRTFKQYETARFQVGVLALGEAIPLNHFLHRVGLRLSSDTTYGHISATITTD